MTVRAAFFDTDRTDSVADLPMLEEVTGPRVVNPNRRLVHVAHRRGWSIESWT